MQAPALGVPSARLHPDSPRSLFRPLASQENSHLLWFFCEHSGSSSDFNAQYDIIKRRRWQTTPVLLPGKSHGWRSLVACSPWGRTESDTPERLHFDFSLSCTEEGNGNPLQCSCLENPRDGENLVGCRLWVRTESDTTEAT